MQQPRDEAIVVLTCDPVMTQPHRTAQELRLVHAIRMQGLALDFQIAPQLGQHPGSRFWRAGTEHVVNVHNKRKLEPSVMTRGASREAVTFMRVSNPPTKPTQI